MFPIVDPQSIARIADIWIALYLPVALKGCLLVGLLLLAARLMRPASAAARHLLWALGMIALLLLPVLEAGLPSWQVLPVPGALSFRVVDAAPGRSTFVPASAVVPVARVPIAAAPAAASALDRAREAGPFHALRDSLASVPPAVWSFSLWLSGMLPLLAAFAWGMARLRRLQKAARPLAADGWPELLRSSCRELGIDAPPALLVSPRALAPMTWGVRSPVVLLPGDCRGWSEELRRLVLLHELAHVRRRDCLTQLAAQSACLLHWFNPLVWMAARQMRVERERACDDLVLVTGARPSTYANHLLQIACHLGARERALSAGLAMARRSRIFDRLDAVLDARCRRRAPSRRAIVLAAGLILAFVAGLSAVSPMARAYDEASLRSAVGRGHRTLSLPEPSEPPESPAVPEPSESPGSPALPEPSESPGSPALPALPSLASLSASGLDIFASGRSRSCEYQVDGVKVKMEMEGKIEFKEDYTGIARMDRGASFAIEEKRGSRRTSLRAEPGEGGQPVYEFRVGRESRPFDAEAAAWLARVIELVMLESGTDADVRVRRVYNQEGLRGVLELINRVRSESARGIYYSELFRLDNLPDDAITEILRRVGRQLDSDYTLACILIAYVDGYLQREATREAFLACLSSLDSDYETRRVLQSGLDRRNRSPEELAVLLAAVGDMRSDYEAGQFLAAFDPNLLADAGTSRAYFAALDGLDSDYEKANVLTTLARRAGRDEHLREAFLEAARHIESEYEYARVVRALQ